MKRPFLLTVISLLAIFPSVFSQKSTDTEKKVIAYIEQHLPHAMNILNDSTATSQKANSMKGGDVFAILALQAFNAYGMLDDTNITVYFTDDVEGDGEPLSASRGDFIERAKLCDIALGFESGHAPGETINLTNFPFLMKRSALLIHRLTSGK
jgi:hypothetical protein